jgi:hypothetical protein
LIGLGLPTDEKSEAAQQRAGEPDAEPLGAKNAKPPVRKEVAHIERRNSNGTPGKEVALVRERTEEGNPQASAG